METVSQLQYTTLDIVFAVLILLGAVRGLIKGLSFELASLTGSLIALVAGWYYYQPLSQWVAQVTRLQGDQARLAAFVSILIGVIIVALILRLMIGGLLQITFKQLERLGGVVVGAVRMLIVLIALLFAVFLSKQPWLVENCLQGTYLGRTVTPYFPESDRLTPPEAPAVGWPTVDIPSIHEKGQEKQNAPQPEPLPEEPAQNR